ncbi:hypothetical protein [Bradyrhizobium erythrophlei]|jgi:hypothetical protein|uniref:Uncharacterized protein n=1 Tax=Bradyrhizobium erythrophlei TaxID=1437360 RepID=A0A1M5XMQ9_9BRAD|nr:hypothetical protein [Bradyrhizobium erythrophlei]SHI00523.1 hypothetical protein SAMN05443248_7433 [Bradyrhizobium erythrophlei]
MNRIIREHYPASRLPEDLRAGVDPSSTVTVTIVEEEKRPEKVMSLEEIFALRRPPFRTAEEIDEDLRRQRDEWDD